MDNSRRAQLPLAQDRRSISRRYNVPQRNTGELTPRMMNVRVRCVCAAPVSRSTADFGWTSCFWRREPRAYTNTRTFPVLRVREPFRPETFTKKPLGCAVPPGTRPPARARAQNHVEYISLNEGFASPGIIGGNGELLVRTCLPF